MRMFAAFNARNLDGWMADATEDVEVESRFSSVAHTTFRGRDGVVSWWDDLAEAWDPIQAELESSWDVSTDETVILITLHGKGRNSELPLDEPVALRWRWREGRLTRMKYMDRHEAELIVQAHP
jgi:ketosteroid isomerase-like protein